MTNTQIKVLVGLVFGMTALVLLIQGQPPSKEWFHSFSWVVTGVAFALLLWDKWAWTWRGLRWLSKRPDLRGTWKGNIKSDWEDPVAQQRRAAIEIYVVVRQTFSTLDVRLFSAESTSQSLSANIVTDAVGLHTVAVTYLNTPSVLHLEHSPIGHGGMLLGVRGDGRIHQLDGKYWTDRKTKGEVKLTQRSKTVCHDFTQAKATFR
jgi:hypothetical protein